MPFGAVRTVRSLSLGLAAVRLGLFNAGRITVNGKVAKASLNVKPGDIIEISFGDKQVKVEVLSIEETYNKEAAKELYKML